MTGLIFILAPMLSGSSNNVAGEIYSLLDGLVYDSIFHYRALAFQNER